MNERIEEGFELGEWLVEPQIDRLTRDGHQITLQPQTMQVLLYLAQHAGQVVSNDELLDAVWGGRPMSDQPTYKCVQKLRESLGDDRHAPRYIVTIPRRGYRLIAPVHPRKQEWGKATPQGVRRSHWHGWYGLLGIIPVAVAVIAIVSYPWSSPPVESPPGSVGILPFIDVSGGETPTSLVDGIYEDVLMSATQISALRVISPRTMRRFRDATADASEIASLIGVNAIMEGAVQGMSNGLRINVKLIDARSNLVQWAARYDYVESDSSPTDVTDRIARDMARELGLKMDGPSRPAMIVGLDAYELFATGRRLIELRTRASLIGAIESLERALRLDGDYALAHAMLARAYILAGRQGLHERIEVRQQAEDHIGQALALQPRLAEAHVARAEFHIDFGDLREAERALRRAIETSPSHPLAHATLGRVLRRQGRLQESYTARLSAHEIDPLDAALLQDLGHMEMVLGSYEEAISSFRKSRVLAPEQLFALRAMSFWAAEYGHLDDALRLAQEYALEAPRDNHAKMSVAHAYLALGDVARAGQWIERVAQPDDTWAYRVEYCRTAVYLAGGEADQAATKLRAGFDISGAADEGSGSLARRQRYALAAKASLFAGDPVTAVRLFDLAFAQGTTILASEDDAHFIGLRAAAYQAAGEEALARAARTRAARILENLRAAGDARPALLFELGALEALAGHNETALEYLEAAISGGWRLHHLNRDDPRLAGLGTEPAFAARIADLDSSVAAMRQNEMDPESFEADYRLALAADLK